MGLIVEKMGLNILVCGRKIKSVDEAATFGTMAGNMTEIGTME